MSASKPQGSGATPPEWRAVSRLSFLAVVGLAVWYAFAFLTGVIHAQEPAIPAASGPGARDVRLTVIVLACACACAALISRTRTTRRTRASYDADFTRELARAIKMDGDAVVLRVHARNGLTPTDATLVGVTVPAGARDALVQRFAALAGTSQDRVRVDVTKKGTRVRTRWEEERATAPAPTQAAQPAAAPATPEDQLPWEDPTPPPALERGVNEEAVRRMREVASGTLGVEVEVTPFAVTRVGVPTGAYFTYPVSATTKVRKLLGEFLSALSTAFPSVHGVWKMKWEPEKNRIAMRDATDPLAGLVAQPPVVEAIPSPGEVVATLGVTDDGTPWQVPIGAGYHIALVGASGAGKGSIVWGIIRALSWLASQGLVRLWVADPKGGLELGKLEGAVHQFAVTDEATIKMLNDARETLRAKAEATRRLGVRKVPEFSREFPLDVVLVDECSSLARGQSKNEFNAIMADLKSQGRAVEFCVIEATQQALKSALPTRELSTYKIALRLDEDSHVDLLLGPGTRAAGALCDQISRDLPGTGYVVMDGAAGVIRARAAFVGDEDIPAIAAAYRQGKLAPPEHTSPPAGRVEQAALYDEEDRQAEQQRRARAALRPAPDPEPESADEKWIAVYDLADMLDAGEEVYVRLEGDTDVVQVTAVDESPDEADRVLVTYRYAGMDERVTELDDTDSVALRTVAEFV